VIRTEFRYKSAAAAVLMALGIAIISSAAQADKTPPPELVQYIRDTKRRGLTDAKIKSQAVAVGWPAAAVDEALVYVRNTKAPPSIPVAETTAPAAGSSTPTPSQEPGPVPASPQPALPDHPASASRGVPDDYVIGSGDTLQISVWKEPEASVPVAVVRPDGKVTVPLIKEIEVAGLTPTQAEQKITERLTKFITDANVTVVVATISSKKIYVIGAARKEGPLPYTYGMSVMQALSEAGGITEYAKRKKIYILRTENGREYRLDFNYDEVVKGERMEQNILLLPSDTVVIPH
jgi:polysaccharide biosynthesis/export protein